MASEVRPLTGGSIVKGGHNEAPSQITERPPAPGAITRKPSLARQTFPSAFAFGDRVLIDGCDTIKATVIGVLFRHTGQETELAWMNGGAQQTAWVAAWRLTLVE